VLITTCAATVARAVLLLTDEWTSCVVACLLCITPCAGTDKCRSHADALPTLLRYVSFLTVEPLVLLSAPACSNNASHHVEEDLGFPKGSLKALQVRE
jgi:hypothetical protein